MGTVEIFVCKSKLLSVCYICVLNHFIIYIIVIKNVIKESTFLKKETFKEEKNRMEAIIIQKDEEIANLLSENRLLNSEISQCKSDKEFVWSLWQQLQKNNPDVTQAVNFVMQREKAQNEQKDAKVLEILNAKDTEIRRLKNEVELLKSTKEDLTKTNRRLSTKFNEELNEVEGLRREIENMTNTFEHIDPKLIIPVVEKRLTRISGELNTNNFINQLEQTKKETERITRENEERSQKINCELRRSLDLKERELVQLNTELEKQLSTVETLKLQNKELVATIEQNKTKFDDQVKCLKLKFVENEDRLKHNLTDQDFKFNNKLKLAEEKCREDSLELENSLHKEIRTREEKHKREIEIVEIKLAEEFKQKVCQLKNQFAKELEDKEDFYEKILQEERFSFERRIKNQEEESCQKQVGTDLNNKRKQHTLEREFHQRVEDLENEHSVEVKKIKEEHKYKLEKLEEFYNQNIKEEQEKCCEDIKRKEKKYKYDIDLLEEKVRSLDLEYKKKLQCESRKHKQEIENQEEKYQSLKLQLERKLCQLEVEQREKEERELFHKSLDNIA